MDWYLKEWRKHRELTLEKLAEMADLSAGYLSQLENGKRDYTRHTLEALAAALDCRPADLINGPPGQAAEVVNIWDRIPSRSQNQALRVLETFADDEKKA